MEKYLFTKDVDKSVLHQGITIPVSTHELLYESISKHLKHGENVSISISIDGELFCAELKNLSFDTEKFSNRKDIVQIRYGSSNPIINKLRETFPSTNEVVNQFLASRKSKEERLSIPQENREYIKVSFDDNAGAFIFECIPQLKDNPGVKSTSFILERQIKTYLKSQEYIVDLEREKNNEALRLEFIRAFPLSSLNQLTLDRYCLGLESYKDSFCYWIEDRLNDIGNIHGATSAKFGVYYGRKGNDHENKFRWTSWTNGSFDIVKNAIVELVSAGATKDISAVAGSQLSPMFRGKILSCYFPELYLNIYSYEYVKYYLKKLGIFEYPSLEEAQQLLIEIKNSNPISGKWSNLLFCYFLSYVFPEAKTKTSEELKEETPVIVGKEMTAITSSSEYEGVKYTKSISDRKSNYKPDYEKAERQKRFLGNEGENAVLNFEKKRLADAGRQDLAEKVLWISKKSDAYGFDIISYDEVTENEKHIEVKTSSASGNTVGFYLTDNEYQNLLNDPDFSIYYVSNVYNKPSLYILDHMQLKDRFSELSRPVLYKVEFKSSDL